MTRFEIELLAIALYESQARRFFERDGFTVSAWCETSHEDRDNWRRAAREIHAEPTSA